MSHQIRNADHRKRLAEYSLNEWRIHSTSVLKHAISLDDQRYFLQRLVEISTRSHIPNFEAANDITVHELKYANFIYVATLLKADKLWMKFVDSMGNTPEGRLHKLEFRKATYRYAYSGLDDDLANDCEAFINHHVPKGVTKWSRVDTMAIPNPADNRPAIELEDEPLDPPLSKMDLAEFAALIKKR